MPIGYDTRCPECRHPMSEHFLEFSHNSDDNKNKIYCTVCNTFKKRKREITKYCFIGVN